MKKTKLFLMLALLVVGVSNAWAWEREASYDVEYVGLPTGVSGDYTISKAYDGESLINFNREGIDESQSNSTLIVMKNSGRIGSASLTTLTNSNYSTYFRPNTVTGYDFSVDIDRAPSGNTHGHITITYTLNVDNVAIGDYIYSTKYWQSGQANTSIQLPAGEIAIALNPRFTETVTEQYVDGNSIRQRQRQAQTSHVVNAVIPEKVTIGGQEFTVVAIQKLGFTYAQNYIDELKNCSQRVTNPRNDAQKEADGIYSPQVWNQNSGVSDVSRATLNDHSNWYLESVTFEAPENIKYIGDYAFQSCVKLKSIVIPKNVEYLGTGVCSTCPVLNDVRFQVDNTTHRTEITTLRTGSFFLCKSLETLELPDGITTIQGASSSDHSGTFGPLQYMTKLTLIRLPNTLTTIGSHFLCSCSSLREVTIPASVTYIDGAAFHGCESLESVYLLGPHSVLEANEGDGSETFGENRTLCKEHVSGCTFYTTPDYIAGYQNDPVWSKIDEDGKFDGTTRTNEAGREVTCNNANKLVAFQGEKRDFEGGKWVTAIFPHGVTNYKSSVFGANTRVAIPDVNTHPTMSYGMNSVIYNVTFKLISGNDIPAATPVMFCPENTVEDYEMISISDYSTAGFKEEMTKDHIVHPQTAEDGAHIYMKGWYQTHTLLPWDFYFMYKNKTVDENGNPTYTDDNERAKFYRVPKATENGRGVRAGATRCWWTVRDASGIRIPTEIDPDSNAKAMFFFDDETTGINNVETRINIEGIYDLQGRKIDVKQSDLPQGMYIVNGKKFIKK